jgi:hypothetical protein
MVGGGPAQAEIGVDDLDICLLPAKIAGTLAKRVLQAQALLVAQNLVRMGLTDVDHGPAAQVPGRHEFGNHRSPSR